MSNDNSEFYALLSDTSETVKRPRSAPECWLIATISGPEFLKSKNKGTRYARHTFTNIEPHPSIAKDEKLAAATDGLDWQALRSPFTQPPALICDFWMSEDAIHRYYNMIDRVVGGRNRSGAERVDEIAGTRVVLKVKPVRDEEGNDTGQNEVDDRSIGKA